VSQSNEDSQSCHIFATKEGETLHSCEEILDEAFSSRPDLTNTAIPNADLELFTDGSQSLQEGGYQTGCAVTTVTQVVECGRLPGHWSAQRAVIRPHQGPHPSRWKESQYLH
jgi:hypothetical protein